MGKKLKAKMEKLKKIDYSRIDFNDDNFHRIAISNLETQARVFERWWEKKYSKPLKEFEDHTDEELYIKMLEDYYDNNPVEIERFRNSVIGDDNWKGETDDEYEVGIQERLKKHHVDISEYQSEKGTDEVDLMGSLRDALPDKNEADDDFSFLGK